MERRQSQRERRLPSKEIHSKEFAAFAAKQAEKRRKKALVANRQPGKKAKAEQQEKKVGAKRQGKKATTKQGKKVATKRQEKKNADQEQEQKKSAEEVTLASQILMQMYDKSQRENDRADATALAAAADYDLTDSDDSESICSDSNCDVYPKTSEKEMDASYALVQLSRSGPAYPATAVADNDSSDSDLQLQAVDNLEPQPQTYNNHILMTLPTLEPAPMELPFRFPTSWVRSIF